MVAGHPGDKLTNVINANVKEGVKRLKGLEPILAKLVNAGELKVVGGSYQLSTGKVELLG
jgi:carbonic anhydrase